MLWKISFLLATEENIIMENKGVITGYLRGKYFCEYWVSKGTVLDNKTEVWGKKC